MLPDPRGYHVVIAVDEIGADGTWRIPVIVYGANPDGTGMRNGTPASDEVVLSLSRSDAGKLVRDGLKLTSTGAGLRLHLVHAGRAGLPWQLRRSATLGPNRARSLRHADRGAHADSRAPAGTVRGGSALMTFKQTCGAQGTLRGCLRITQ
jgi:hypothetical protein